jgi:PPK2 family polyphosphate:nucleotide phosphotransferase
MSDKAFKALRVEPGTKVDLKDYDTAWADTRELRELGRDQPRQRARERLAKTIAELAEAQERLYASGQWAVLLTFQAMDAAGKDGTIKHVMSGINPQGCQVYSFKQPTREELAHNFLWRYARVTPERGRIGIFNRSYYEDVLVVRVHPELLEAARLPRPPRGPDDAKFWDRRLEDINAFEHHLARNGTLILKFFLHVSLEEQKRRLLERLNNPRKQWKFDINDLAERRCWQQYMDAYEKAISATSTRWGPWYIVPADQKWVTRSLVADIVAHHLRKLDLEYPQLSARQREALAEGRRQLEAE